jgi:hypothetical protein
MHQKTYSHYPRCRNISIDSKRARQNYGLTAEETFWCKQGIFRNSQLRDSEDEEMIADLASSLLLGSPIARSRELLDELYDLQTEKAQTISDGWEAKRIHERLNELARLCCPIYRDFATGYHWSVNQCEYATDVVFRKQADLQAICGNLTRTAIHTVKPDNIATFLGKKLSTQFEGEMGIQDLFARRVPNESRARNLRHYLRVTLFPLRLRTG